MEKTIVHLQNSNELSSITGLFVAISVLSPQHHVPLHTKGCPYVQMPPLTSTTITACLLRPKRRFQPQMPFRGPSLRLQRRGLTDVFREYATRSCHTPLTLELPPILQIGTIGSKIRLTRGTLKSCREYPHSPHSRPG